MRNASKSSSPDLSKRVAIVTGASRGIGRAIAFALVRQGAAVALGSRNLKALEKLAGEMEGANVFAHALDVRDEISVAGFLQASEEKLGPADILVNNAGIYRSQSVKDHSLPDWRDIIDTNLTSALLTSRHVLPGMIERNWGRIINISSISGKTGEAFGSAYSASKFGLIGLTQALALEAAKHGITVNAVCPGWVDTKMAAEQLQDEHYLSLTGQDRTQSEEIARLSVPQMRFIEPEEVADLVVYLCSHGARGITGQAINICGGLSLH